MWCSAVIRGGMWSERQWFSQVVLLGGHVEGPGEGCVRSGARTADPDVAVAGAVDVGHAFLAVFPVFK